MDAIAGVILMVLTSSAQMDNGEPTGLWLEEFSVPYAMFVEAGFEVEVVSLLGGAVPVDARSVTDATRPENAEMAMQLLEETRPLAVVDPERFDAVFFPGGHGTMFDMPGSETIQDVVRSFIESGRPSAFICHGPAALTGVLGSDGEPIVKGRSLTGFTDEEESAVELTEAMPFLLESRLRELGANFREGGKFEPFVVVDGNLVTGQNPASSQEAAAALIEQLRSAGSKSGAKEGSKDGSGDH